MIRLIPVVIYAGLLGSCALTAVEIDEIARQSAELAAEKAAKLAYDLAIKEGLSELAAREVANAASDRAREIARDTVTGAIPEAEGGKSTKWGALFGSIILAILQLFTGGSRRTLI